jgi:predicted nucleic acid-binding protein
MSSMRPTSRKRSYLAQAIRGYRGYASSRVARRTDQVFSEEILSKLSDTMATIGRMRRLAGDTLAPEAIPSLDALVQSVDRLSKYVAQTEPTDDTLLQTLEDGKADEIVSLDSDVMEKIGNVNQALSMMDLEAGVGISPDELESVSELVDDLADCLRKRSMLITG